MSQKPIEGYARYAVYYAPDTASALGRLGAAWLADGAGIATPRPAAALTVAARRYGLHATLKAPFRLREGTTAAALDAAVAALAGRLAPARAEGLAVADLKGFAALRPVGDTAEIDAAAAACVTELDAFRAPLTQADLARRGADALDPGARALLERWGYPWVLDRFAMHVTLTGRLEDGERAATLAALRAAFDPVAPRPFVLDALSLFGDPGEGPFVPLRRHPLGGPARAGSVHQGGAAG